MNDLDQLKKAFENIQNSTSKINLSERTCINILSKLIELHKVTIFNLNNGSGFITASQLDSEIYSELRHHGGRVNLIEISMSIGVSLSLLEARVFELIKKERKKLYIINNDLIRSSYFEKICEEVNELLQESGQLSIADLADKFMLPVNIIKDEISHRIAALNSGILRQTTFTTYEFNFRIFSIIRGSFLGATNPINITEIANSFNLDQNSVATTAQNYLKKNFIGKIEKGYFYPFYYLNFQASRMENFLKDNHFISLSEFRETDGFNTKKYLMQHHSDGVLLSNYFLEKHLIDLMYRNIEEVIRSDSWFDLSPFIPHSMTNFDVQELMSYLETHNSNNLNCIWLKKSNSIFSSGFIIFIVNELSPQIESQLLEYFKNNLITLPILKEKLKNEEEFQKKKQKDKSRSKEEKKSSKSKIVETDSSNELNANEILKTVLEKQFNDKQNEQIWMDFTELHKEELIENLFSKFLPLYHSTKLKSQHPFSDKLKFKYQDISNILIYNFEILQLYIKAFEYFEQVLDKTSIHLLLKSLFHFIFDDIFDPLIKLMYYDKQEQEIEITSKNRVSIIESLIEDSISQNLKIVLNILLQKDLKNLVISLSNAFTSAGLMAKLLIKKRQKQLLSQFKSSLELSLSKSVETDCMTLIHTFIMTKTLNVLNIYPFLPNQTWSLSTLWSIYTTCLISFTDQILNSHIQIIYKLLNELEGLKKMKFENEDKNIDLQLSNFQELFQSKKHSLEIEATKFIDILHNDQI